MSLVYNGVNTDTVIYNGQPTTGLYNGVVIWPARQPSPQLPDYTLRLKYKEGVTPIFSNGNGVQVSSSPNIWDLTYENTNWGRLLYNQTNLLEVIDGNTTGVTNMYKMFYNCRSLTTVPLFDTSNVTNMESMFHFCNELTNIPLFNTSNVTNMGSMFDRCNNLTTVPLFDTSNVTNMNAMFNGCSSLTTVPLFVTSSVTDMGGMFASCTNLTTVPLFDTYYVTNMNNMFDTCTNVQSGALVLYQQASTQTTPPTYHRDTFTNCGRDTQTGSAELAQIPTSWGGTGA